MAQVTVTIDGKAYRMACEAGQEDHLHDLAARFDGYVSHLRGQFGEIGDLRLTVMAGIMIIDELSDTRAQLESNLAELQALRGEKETAGAETGAREAEIAAALEALSSRISALSAKITAG
ncbi:cell division protein ZapA [Martelella sp. HB161492]|uniref:cell division protein ZapA n=1 Tax=Martelella sp. HB161492 TaxID=2720726 RepID=UPI001591DF20|nr:cell division protein ZapA [Martelella sp. HB161492]